MPDRKPVDPTEKNRPVRHPLEVKETEPRVEVFEQIGPNAYHGPAGTVILGPELPADG